MRSGTRSAIPLTSDYYGDAILRSSRIGIYTPYFGTAARKRSVPCRHAIKSNKTNLSTGMLSCDLVGCNLTSVSAMQFDYTLVTLPKVSCLVQSISRND